MSGWWICRLCEAEGDGGRGEWQHHYLKHHWRQLEKERRKPVVRDAKPTYYGGQR